MKITEKKELTMNRSILGALFGIIMISGALFGQGNISGSVTDADGNALPGANVVVEGTVLGAAATLNGGSGKQATKYLNDRFFDKAIIEKFNIGFASDSWDLLYKELYQKFDEEVIEKSGLFSNGKKGFLDRFRNRIMFPFYSPSGKAIGFSGRSLSDKEDVKYLNSPETLLFQKSKVFYGSYQTMPEIRRQNYVLLVEGQTDFLRLYEKGFKNVLAT